jgi:hypothetical protein
MKNKNEQQNLIHLIDLGSNTLFPPFRGRLLAGRGFASVYRGPHHGPSLQESRFEKVLYTWRSGLVNGFASEKILRNSGKFAQSSYVSVWRKKLFHNIPPILQ